MSFYGRLKESRINAGYTQEQLANKIGVAKSTLSGYESGNRDPSMYTISKIMEILNVDANFLWQDEIDEQGGSPMCLKYEEMEHIEKYRALDPPGQSHVDSVLQWETERVQQIEQAASTVVEVADSDSQGRVLQYFHSVSAGAGEVLFDDVYTERITVPNKPQYHRVAYAVKVSGHSMEPLYHDKDILLVEPTCEISVGEIGIFNVNGQAYVKKLGKGKLISLNKGYDDVPLTEESLCMGRVVDSLKS